MNNIYNEMLTHVAVCTHKKPENLLIVGAKDSGCLAEVAKYDGIKVECSEHIESFGDKAFDIVIVDLDVVQSSEFYDSVARVLSDDGVVVTAGGNYFEDLKSHKAILADVARNFIVAMPYRTEGQTLILASKVYHPTADVILQRADLLEGVEYYNSDIQIASFVKPTYIHKALLGIAKN